MSRAATGCLRALLALAAWALFALLARNAAVAGTGRTVVPARCRGDAFRERVNPRTHGPGRGPAAVVTGTGRGKCESFAFWDAAGYPLHHATWAFQGDFVDGEPVSSSASAEQSEDGGVRPRGEYVEQSGWLQDLRPPSRTEGKWRVYYDGGIGENFTRDGNGLFELTSLGLRYFGAFSNNSFRSTQKKQEVELKFADSRSRRVSSRTLPESPFENRYLVRTVRYLGPTLPGGIPHGQEGEIAFRGKGFGSPQNWTRMSGVWENGILVSVSSLTAVTGEKPKSAVSEELRVVQWDNARSAIVGHRSLVARIVAPVNRGRDENGGDNSAQQRASTEYSWDGSRLTVGSDNDLDTSDARGLALQDALLALHVFEDHVRDPATVDFVENFRFRNMHSGVVEELKKAGKWYQGGPTTLQ